MERLRNPFIALVAAVSFAGAPACLDGGDTSETASGSPDGGQGGRPETPEEKLIRKMTEKIAALRDQCLGIIEGGMRVPGSLGGAAFEIRHPDGRESRCSFMDDRVLPGGRSDQGEVQIYEKDAAGRSSIKGLKWNAAEVPDSTYHHVACVFDLAGGEEHSLLAIVCDDRRPACGKSEGMACPLQVNDFDIGALGGTSDIQGHFDPIAYGPSRDVIRKAQKAVEDIDGRVGRSR